MGPEKLSALGIIFAVLSPALSIPAPPGEMHYGAFGNLKKLCKSLCAEAKGNSKFHDASLTCFCEIPKTTTDVTASLLAKKAQENCMSLKIIKRNSIAKRETNTLELDNDMVSPNTAEKRWVSLPSENVLGQAAPNTFPQRQQQNAKGSELAESTEVSNQRLPNLSKNKKTLSISSEVVVKEMEPEASDLNRKMVARDVQGQVLSNKPNKRQMPSEVDADDFLGQASPNTVPQRQQQNEKPLQPVESIEASRQRPPNVSSKRTSALSSEIVKEMEPKGPNLNRETGAKDFPNEANKKRISSQFEAVDYLGQASANTVPLRQQQNAEGSASPVEPIEGSSQRPPHISNIKTSALSDFVKDTEPEGPNLKREMDVEDMRDGKVRQVFPKGASKREIENFLRQAFPNIVPQHQQQDKKDAPPSDSTEVNSQRPSNIINKKTSALSGVKKEGEQEIPNLRRALDNNIFGDKDSKVSPNMVDKRQAFLPFDLEDDLGQANPNIVPQLQQQAESKSPKGESVNSSNQRSPITSNKTLVSRETLQSTESRGAEMLPSSGHTMRRSTSSLQKINNLQGDSVDLTQKNSNLKRGMNLEGSSVAKASDSENVVGQASPNTTSQRHQQNHKSSSHSETSSSQKPPIISNKKTLVVSEVIKEAEPEALRGKPEAPIPTDKKASSASSTSKENFVRSSSDLLVNMVGEGEPKQTTRRSTPSPRKPPAFRRTTYNNEPIRRALESARQHIDTLIQRANQPSFNPSTIGAEIEAISASLRSVSHRVNESARNMERSALVEQIRERERERHARIHSRFGGGHEDRPRKLKPLLVGSANPKDKGAASKTEEPQGKKDERKETAQKGATIITQPPELVED